MGGYYNSEVEYEYEELYCEQCYDSDMYVGYMTEKEFKKLYKER